MYRLKIMNFHSSKLTWLQLLMSTQYASSRDQDYGIQNGIVSQVDQPATWQQVYYNEPLPLWKGQHFVLTAIDTLDMDLLSCHTNASAKTTICGLLEYLIHHHGVSHSTFIKEFTSQQMKCSNGTCGQGIHWSYYVRDNPKAAGFIEWWNGLLEIQLQDQVGGSSLQD